MSVYSDQSKQYINELVKLTKKNLIAIGYQQLTVAGTAVGLTVPAEANYAIVEVESSITTPAIRYLELGNKTLPTSSTGIRRSELDAIDVSGYQNLINFRAIQISAGTHVLNIQYYK